MTVWCSARAARLASLLLVSACTACDDAKDPERPGACDAGRREPREASSEARVVREDAHPDARKPAPRDATADTLGANACPFAIDGGAGVWPLGTSSAASKCVPHCDLSECGATCEKGSLPTPVMACDTGCCEANDAFSKSMGGLRSTTVATSPSGRIYFAGVSRRAELVYAATDDPTMNVWPESGTLDPPATIDSGTLSRARTEQGTRFAFGKVDGREAVFVEYGFDADLASDPASRLRFGIQVGSTWTFEDLPAASSGLASDATGAALVLLNDRILRRKPTGGWDSEPLPGALVVAGRYAKRGDHLAVGDEGAWYVVRSDTDSVIVVGRRDPEGSWAIECFPRIGRRAQDSGAPSFLSNSTIAHGAGTVHVAYTSTNYTADSRQDTSDIHYARRTGSGWTQSMVASDEQVKSLEGGILRGNIIFDGVALAIDRCGTPHIAGAAFWASDFRTFYIRWTSLGWRQTVFDPLGSTWLSLSLTSDFALIGAGDTFVRIPKR